MNTNEPGFVPDPEIVRRLRAARDLTGLDQTAFAKLTGISRSIISQYETGANTDYKWPFMIAWAYCTPVTLEWLWTGQESVTPSVDGRPLLQASPQRNNDRYPVAA
jgi:transcriptional regulator with XRE-family HTH domain